MPYPLKHREARRVITTGMSDTEILRILQEARDPRERRATQSFDLENATEFSADRIMKDDVFLFEQLKSIPDLWEPLRAGTTDPDELKRERGERVDRVGRPRMQGDIAPLAMSFVLKTKPEMQHYLDTNLRAPIWDLAGWTSVPSYVTFWSRITEAEREHIPAWEQASRYCWAAVRRNLPDAGLHWVIDGTPYETHVLLHHDCPDKAKCAAAKGEMPKIIQRAGKELIDTERQAKQKEAPEDEDAEPLPLNGELTRESLLSELAERLSDEDFEESALDETYPEGEMPKYRRKRPKRQPGEKLEKEIWINDGPDSDPETVKHRYVARDADSGFRIYQQGGKKFRQWVGGFAITITDLTTGCQIAQFHIPSDQNEHTAYLDVLALGVRMTGRLPQNVITDRAYNTRRIRQINALLGIGQICGWRKPHPTIKKRSDMRKDTHDEYGIPTCRYCGGPGVTFGKKDVGFQIRKGKPVIRYRCAAPVTQACCNRLQRRPCELEWLLLGNVVSREDPLYYELRSGTRPTERAHQNSRTRTGQAGNNLTSRPKRIGIPFMAYRAAVGAFLDVFRLCLRFGWLGSHPKPRPVILKRRKGGDEAAADLRKRRERKGLLLPRGKAAEKLGLLFQGLLPDGYKTIRERKRQRTIAAKKAAEEKKAAKKASSSTKGKAKPPPDAPAA